MKKATLRSLYALLLLLHPPAFRRRFAAEMLNIFEEAPLALAPSLFVDGIASLVRQWVLRSKPWKPAGAILGACLQLLAGGLIFLIIGREDQVSASIPDAAGIERPMQLILWCTCPLVLMVIAASLWLRKFLARHSHGVSR